MKVLLVEDDETIVDIFQSEAGAGAFTLTQVADRTEAMAVLREGSFHLIVCDLKIPTSSKAMDEDPAHGRAVLTEVIESHAGTPVIAFSAHGTLPVMQELLERARHADYLGEGVAAPMISFFRKDQITECLAKIHEIGASMAGLDSIEIATGINLIDLDWEHERVLRIYARKLGATVVKVSPLSGGMSHARVLRLRLESAGAHVASVVAKLDTIATASAENDRVETLVGPTLLSGSYPSAVTLVSAGASRCGGLFYRFAGGYETSLVDLIASPSAGQLVAKIRSLLSPWVDGARVEEVSLASVRELLAYQDKVPQDVLDQASAAEASTISSRWCTAHCDLHVFNVLVGAGETPMVIDFGAVQAAPPSLDPITLELSLFFHPEARKALGSNWPSVEQAERWDDLAFYLENCPAPMFVTACREWAFDVAAGDREVFAGLYAYAARQFQFDPDVHPVAAGLVSCALRRLST